MATVIPQSAVMIATVGCVAYWKATRLLRQTVINALKAVGEAVVPPIDHYDAAVETGKAVIKACNISAPRCPVKFDSLSRTGAGVEFFQTYKGDKRNQREFLFSLGVDEKNQSICVLNVGTHPNLVRFFANPNVDTVLNQLFQTNLAYMPSRDVTDALVGMVGRNKGVPLKDGGGVYFIPECAITDTDAVFSALNSAGCRCTLLKQDLKNNQELCKQVLEATNEDLVEQCEKMNEVMEDLLANSKVPRANGMKTRMEQLARYTKLCEYYEQQFGTNLQAARDALSKSHELLAELQIRKSSGK